MITKYEDLLTIKKFKDKLTSTDKISQHDIKNFETQLGFNLITKEIRLPKFTTYPSEINYRETLNIINNVIFRPMDYVSTEGLLSGEGDPASRGLIDSYNYSLASNIIRRPCSIFGEFIHNVLWRFTESSFLALAPLDKISYIGNLSSYDFDTNRPLGLYSIKEFLDKVSSSLTSYGSYDECYKTLSKIFKFKNKDISESVLKEIRSYSDRGFSTGITYNNLKNIDAMNCSYLFIINLLLYQVKLRTFSNEEYRYILKYGAGDNLIGDIPRDLLLSHTDMILQFFKDNGLVNPVFHEIGIMPVLVKCESLTLFGFDMLGRILEVLGYRDKDKKRTLERKVLEKYCDLFYKANNTGAKDNVLSYFDATRRILISDDKSSCEEDIIIDILLGMFDYYYTNSMYDFNTRDGFYPHEISFEALLRISYDIYR